MRCITPDLEPGNVNTTFFFVLVVDIFGISDHDLMYSKEAVETTDEVSNSSDKEAIQARVREWQTFSSDNANKLNIYFNASFNQVDKKSWEFHPQTHKL